MVQVLLSLPEESQKRIEGGNDNTYSSGWFEGPLEESQERIEGQTHPTGFPEVLLFLRSLNRELKAFGEVEGYLHASTSLEESQKRIEGAIAPISSPSPVQVFERSLNRESKDKCLEHNHNKC